MALEAVDAVVGVAAHEEAQEGGAGVQVEHLLQAELRTVLPLGGKSTQFQLEHIVF